MDIISWFWHPMALYVGFLGLSALVFIGGIALVFALILRGVAKPSTLPPLPGEEPTPGAWPAQLAQPVQPPAPLAPGQLPAVGGHSLPSYTGSVTPR